ncbi:ATP-binding cassette sub-family A member 3 isoform X2 [Folsomia candida]|uniref:ATP-binding cassette sub-family A member 3 isoform X2 n=1 Tax=Folsomia candida TaxID=158441 RepID=UPI00160527AA|nr:ATP-binding cassette sub-family A member 3 isoform X2 [Folsomia candida]
MGIRTNNSRSWTIRHSHAPPENVPPSRTSSWEKFRLLLWKNYKIQIRHNVQTVTEILLPLLFTAVLLIVRNVVPSTFVKEPTIYKPITIEGHPPDIVQTSCDQIYYTPRHPVVDALMQKVNNQYFLSQRLAYNFTGFATEEELVHAYIQSANNSLVNSTSDFEPTAPVLAGVIFTNKFNDGSFPNDIKYTLRFPATQRSEFDLISERFGAQPVWYTELLYPLFQFLGPRAKNQIGGGLPGYHEEGFLYLQYAIDRTLTREFLNSSELENYNKYDIRLQRYPYPSFIDDKYILALQGWLPLIIMMSFIYPAINIAKSIVYEKETRLKEYMKIMGIPNIYHVGAWYVKSQSFLVIAAGLMTLLLKVEFFSTQNLAIFPKADGYVVFLIFLVFTFSLICFSFFIASLFSHSNAAATAAGVLWFVLYVPYGFLRPRYNLLPRKTKLFSCFLTNMGISFACQIICMLEGTGVGAQWSNIFQGSGPDDDFSMGDCLIMMIANGVVYLISALYIEAVRPGEFGVPLPFYFPFTKSFWTSKSWTYESNHEIETSSDVPADFFEAEPKDKFPGIQIKGLTKIYDNGKVALRNLSLNFYQGEITAFLGHNGAGKTTTMSILSGLFPPTSGTALINNCDIRNDINSARSSLGICPQYDILFNELTVEEHLRFYCLMKGCKDSNVAIEINRMIKALGLEDKRNAQSYTLSGGMKRKLSVGISFCGGSKIVILDEPSSGQDVGARRSTWDLIKSEKINRTIVLTTHYMEEADVLGDRIAVMCNGEIQCCGTSLFLKKKYGGGYHLIIVKDENCDVDKITQVIRKTIADVEVDQDVGAELSYTLPDGKSHLFPEMFEELEDRKRELRISSLGASNTTMEEVFIRVGRKVEAKILEQYPQEENERKLSVSLTIDNNELATASKTHLYNDEPLRNVGMALKMQQLRAMVIKKLIYGFRNRMLLMTQMGIPLLYLILILIVVKNLPGISNSAPHKFTLQRYEKLGSTITTVKCPVDEFICKSYKAYVLKNHLIELVGQNQSFIDYMLEKENEDLVSVNLRYIVGFEQRQVKETEKSEYRQLVGFFNNQPFHAPPLSLNFISNALLSPTNHTITITNHPFPVGSIDSLKKAGTFYTLGFQIGNNIALGMSFLAASFSVFIITEKETRSKHIQFVSGLEYPLYWTANFIVDFIQFIIPCFGTMVILFLFQIEEFMSLYMQLNLLLLFVCYGLAVIPLMYLASFAFTVPSSGFTRLVLLNIFTGMASILTVVMIQTREFQLESLADTLNSIFLIFPNYALGMGIVQLSTNFQFARDCVRFNLEFVCPAFPSSVCCSKLKPNFLDWERTGIGKNIACLTAACCVYFVILFIWESRVWTKFLQWNSKIGNSSVTADGLEDADVVKEKKKMEETNLTQLFKENTLVVRNLTKYYDKFLAVDHINLGVQRGECFGLLGVNGAGKTSTFKMLTGDLSISEGEAYICSKSVRRELKQVHEVVGYCPQFDALIDSMTGRETIALYARLRGIQESYIDHLTNCLGEMLLFSQYMDKRVGSYSGGNKRKLSTAIALIGSPPVIFLDEMTTGMDPVARRHMWTAISRIRDSGTSIILTSHSMNECEALCTRIAIMVNGTFRCLNSIQELKNKFGEGYTLIAQTSPKGISESEPFTRETQEFGRRRSSHMSMKKLRSSQGWESELEGLRTFIEESYPGSQLKDIHPGFVHYHIPSQGVTWGSLFRKMEMAKQKFGLDAYSLGQSTLEQIFLAFTKAQN